MHLRALDDGLGAENGRLLRVGILARKHHQPFALAPAAIALEARGRILRDREVELRECVNTGGSVRVSMHVLINNQMRK